MLHNHWLEVLIDNSHTGSTAKLLVACSEICRHSSHSASISIICKLSCSDVATSPSAIEPAAHSNLGDVCGAFAESAAPPCTASCNCSENHSAAAAAAHPIYGVATIGSKSTCHLSFTTATAAQHAAKTATATFRLPEFRLVKPLDCCFSSGWAAAANGSILFHACCSHVEPPHYATKQATRTRARSPLAALQCHALQNISKHFGDSGAGKG